MYYNTDLQAAGQDVRAHRPGDRQSARPEAGPLSVYLAFVDVLL